MSDQNIPEIHWVSDNAGIGVFKENNYDPTVHLSEYVLYVEAQGKTTEIPIDEATYDDIRGSFRNIDS